VEVADATPPTPPGTMTTEDGAGDGGVEVADATPPTPPGTMTTEDGAGDGGVEVADAAPPTPGTMTTEDGAGDGGVEVADATPPTQTDLVGGPGDDTVAGGDGPDIFRFDAASGNDVVGDYQEEDVVELVGVDPASVTFTEIPGEGVLVAWPNASALFEGQTLATFDATDLVFV
jgi:hypothetical protein